MEDTKREDRLIVYDIVLSRTEEERFLLCAEMFETAKEFAIVRAPAGLNGRELSSLIFREIYGFDIPG